MKSLAVFMFAVLASQLAAKPVRFEAGAFAVTIDLNEEDWNVDAQPELNFLHFQKAGGVGLAGGSAFEAFVFVDRIPGEVPEDLQKWFAGYLQRKGGFLHAKVFAQPRRFRPAKKATATVGDRRLICFDMVRRPLTRPASWTTVDEEGVVYFLVLPEFARHRTFFVFTGRQVLSRDLGHRSELGEVEKMVSGFELRTPGDG